MISGLLRDFRRARRSWTRICFPWGLAAALWGAFVLSASAQTLGQNASAETGQRTLFDMLPNQNIADSWIMLIIFVGAFAFAMWSATWLIRERRQLENSNASLALELADLKARHERAQALLDVPDQRVVIWEGRDQPPVCRGTLPPETGAPLDTAQFTAFGTWMKPASAQDFEHAIHRLRERAEAFDMPLETQNGHIIGTQGKISGSHAFVRFISLTEDRATLATLRAEHDTLVQTTDTMQALLQNIPFPVWLASREGQLQWSNAAYLAAVDGSDLDHVVDNNTQLLDGPERAVVAGHHRDAMGDGRDAASDLSGVTLYHGRLPATVSGDRRIMDVSEVSLLSGVAGLAVDMSEVQAVQANLRRTLESHAQTMNQLATAVAIFDEHRHLIFHNDAFEALWHLDPALLENKPDNGRLFDAMREAGALPEQKHWSQWRNDLLRVYEETQPKEDWWHLLDGRTVRVVANPHSHGGVTWVFENITERLQMESRYIALTQVQGETLDHLAEAIAVFAPDGCLKLSNPTFQNLWNLTDEEVAAETKIADIAALCRPLMERPDLWDVFTTGVTGVSDMREPQSGQLTLRNGVICDYALVPLPNGQIMLSFADVTASVQLERSLEERNEALKAAERLKNAFIQRVSYDFRTPLTSIKGFAEMLDSQAFGPLNEKQQEYLSGISLSSRALEDMVDNLIDLASMDAGLLELDKDEVETQPLLRSAAKKVHDQLQEKQLKVRIRQVGGSAHFEGDKTRVAQVLGNLLSNAVTFSPVGGSIVVESIHDANSVSLIVTDEGPGVPEDHRAEIFERFHGANSLASRRGAGLGLTVARAIMDLHKGELELAPSTGRGEDEPKGARFICRFPREAEQAEQPQTVAAQ